jgi:hypothetical protein
VSEPIAALDHGFVRAAPSKVFELLRDPAGYSGWWPGSGGGADGALRLPVLGEFRMDATDLVDGVGLTLRLEGRGLRGHLQWHIDPFRDGSIVYAGTVLEPAGRLSARRLLRYRASLRRAFVGLKEQLETGVAV